MDRLTHRVFAAAYHSPAGRLLSLVARALSLIHRPFMVYGFRDPASGVFRKFVRMSSTVNLLRPEKLSIEDHVWVGHFSLLDASGGLTIEEGVQIGVGVCLYTHGSQNSLRLLGREYVNLSEEERIGYQRAPVVIGRYAFIGSGAVILPGIRIGAGSIIGPNTVVSADVPERGILMAPPSRLIGSTAHFDADYIQHHGVPPHYPLPHPEVHVTRDGKGPGA